MTTTKACPSCGAESAGKFCGECGAPMERTCASCGNELPAGAKFCGECGSAVAGAPAVATRSSSSATWVSVALVGVILLVVGLFLLMERQQQQPAPAASQAPPPAAAAGQPGQGPPISPAEAATQLFNMTMTAAESGDMEEARRLAPWALEAYGQLAFLDADAHYHVGLIHLTVEDYEEARAKVDLIRASAPTHLLGIMLAHAVAEAQGDGEAMARAGRSFLDAYDSEMASGRPEYQHHGNGIAGFRAQVQAESSGS